MANEKQKHPSFAGERPAAIDQVNPPKPASPAPEQKRKPDHFTRERPAAIDYVNPPVEKAEAPTIPGKTK